MWPLARGTQDDVRAAGCVYGSLTYGWDLRKRLRPRLAMEDLIADALERVTAKFLLWVPLSSLWPVGKTVPATYKPTMTCMGKSWRRAKNIFLSARLRAQL